MRLFKQHIKANFQLGGTHASMRDAYINWLKVYDTTNRAKGICSADTVYHISKEIHNEIHSIGLKDLQNALQVQALLKASTVTESGELKKDIEGIKESIDQIEYTISRLQQQTAYIESKCMFYFIRYPLQHWINNDAPYIRFAIKNTIRYFYLYNGTYWEEHEADQFIRDCCNALSIPSERLIEDKDIRGYLRYTIMDSVTDRMMPSLSNVVNLRDKALVFNEHDISVDNHSHSHFCTTSFGFDYDESRSHETPITDAYLNNLASPEDIDIFWRFVAAAFHPTKRPQRLLNIVGVTRIGKSTLLKVIAKLLPDNVHMANFCDFVNDGPGFTHSNFVKQLRGKSLFIGDEADGFAGNKFLPAFFKSFINGDEITLSYSASSKEIKTPFKPPLTITTSNNAMVVPRTVPASEAIQSRITIIKFELKNPIKSSLKYEDEIFEKEGAGILKKICKYYKQLCDSNMDIDLFINQRSIETQKEVRDSQNPVQNFIDWAFELGYIQISSGLKQHWVGSKFLNDLMVKTDYYDRYMTVTAIGSWLRDCKFDNGILLNKYNNRWTINIELTIIGKTFFEVGGL